MKRFTLRLQDDFHSELIREAHGRSLQKDICFRLRRDLDRYKMVEVGKLEAALKIAGADSQLAERILKALQE